MKRSLAKFVVCLCFLVANVVEAQDCEPRVDTVVISSHINTEIVDTSMSGLATGSFFLQGSAPPDAESIIIEVNAESASANVTEENTCEIKWSIEITPPASATVTFAVTATGASGETTASITLQVVAPAEGDALIQPAFAFTPQFHTALLEYNETSGTIVFSGDTSQILKPGDGLGSGITNSAPNGYLRIVLTATYDGSNTTVTTRQAALYEFVRQMGVDYTDSPEIVDLIPKDSNTLVDTGNTSDTGSGRQLVTFPIGASTKLTFDASLKPRGSFKLVIGRGKREPEGCWWFCSKEKTVVKEFAFEVGLDYGFLFKFEHTIADLFEKEENFGPKLDFTFARLTIPTPLFGLPIIVNFRLASQAFYAVSIKVKLTVSYSPKFVIVAGYEYLDGGGGRGGYSDITADANSLDTIDTELSVVFSASVGVEVDIEVLLYGAVGPELEAKPQLVFTASTDLLELCFVKWKVGIEIPFAMNVQVDIGIWEEEFGDVEIDKKVFPLLDGTIPFLDNCTSIIPSLSPLPTSPFPTLSQSFPTMSPTESPGPSPIPSFGPSPPLESLGPSLSPSPPPTRSTPTAESPGPSTSTSVPPTQSGPSPTDPPAATPMPSDVPGHECSPPLCFNYVAEVYPGPHFRTWHNYHYSYHGACDMIFLRNDFLDLHIRTVDRNNFWSTPASAALRIGGKDVVEVTRDHKIYFNGTIVESSALNIVRDTHHILQVSQGVIVLLSGGHFILIQAFEFVGVYVRASFVGLNDPKNAYIRTAGMSGTWNRFGLIGRTGVHFTDVADFAREWQVGLGDPVLFRTSTDQTCEDRPVNVPERDEDLVDSAEGLCGFVRDGYNVECAFDLTVANLTTENPVYIFPLNTRQSARCSATSVDCALRGGSCVVLCINSETRICFPGLCSFIGDIETELGRCPDPSTIPSERCACAVPSTMPSPVPSQVPSMTPTEEIPPVCFSGSTLVSAKDKGTITMRNLKLGDEVMVADGRYERVYSFAHYLPDITGDYLRISFSDEPWATPPLEISRDHLLFISEHRAVQASFLRVGDTVMKASGGVVAVKSIRKVAQMGVYAPFTPSGLLVLNGVLVSCYTGLEGSDSIKLYGGLELSYHYLAHLYQMPHRLWCRSVSPCRRETHSAEGISLWLHYPLKLSGWLLRQSIIVKTSFMMAWLIVFLPLGLLELFLHLSIEMQFTLCALIVGLAYSRRKV